MKRFLYVILITSLSLAAYLYYSDYTEDKKVEQECIEFQNKVDELLVTGVDFSLDSIESSEQTILSEYINLYKTNNDMVGFLSIDSEHQFPVTQRVDDQNYYLDHDFFGDENTSGSVFLNNKCQLGQKGISLIYGHHIKGQKMFGILDNWKDEDYFNSHQTIQLDTLYEKDSYEIVACAIININDEFKYYNFVGALDELSFELWRDGMSEYIIRGSLKDLSYNDKVVELSTCSYERKNNRCILILRSSS